MSTTGLWTEFRSSGFSRAAGGAPDTARCAVLFRPLDPTLRLKPIPGSAPTAAPPGLAPRVLRRPPRPPTHRGMSLAPDGRVWVARFSAIHFRG
uniref:Uncharacterized protein n=1 Tax=Zea mays TaxID=4577 RepID=A0A804RUL0_MAIZE